MAIGVDDRVILRSTGFVGIVATIVEGIVTAVGGVGVLGAGRLLQADTSRLMSNRISSIRFILPHAIIPSFHQNYQSRVVSHWLK